MMTRFRQIYYDSIWSISLRRTGVDLFTNPTISYHIYGPELLDHGRLVFTSVFDDGVCVLFSAAVY